MVQVTLQALIPVSSLAKGLQTFTFYFMPDFKWTRSTHTASTTVPGGHNPVVQFIGGDTTEVSLTGRLVGKDAQAQATQLKILAGGETKNGWAQPPLFAVSGPDPMFNDIMLLTRIELTPNLKHLMNVSLPGERIGDVAVSLTLVRAASFQNIKPVGPAISIQGDKR